VTLHNWGEIKMTKKLALALGLCGLIGSVAAYAATQVVTANIAFDAPLVLSATNANFGTVAAGVVDTYTMTPAGILTAGTPANILYGATNPGSVLISGSTTDTLTISVGSLTANNGVTPSNVTCTYNGGSVQSPCAFAAATAPGAGKTLALGMQLTTIAETAGTTAAPSVTVTVVYN
jgi:hypothetical protein